MINLFPKVPTILISGEITWEKVEKLFEDYDSFSGIDSDDLVVMISSQGGDRDAAISMYSFLKGLNERLTTIAFGKVYSAGIYPFLASPDRRYATIDTTFLFHQTTFDMGEDVTLNSMIENIESDKLDTASLRAILEQFSVRQPIREDMAAPKASLFMLAQGAHSYGLVNHVITKFTEVKFE